MKPSNIEEYIVGLTDTEKKYVSDFISFMKEAYPLVIPKISFSMPMWLAGKKMQDGYVAISVAKKHYTIHFSDENSIEKLKELLPECKSGKQCMNIKYGDEEAYSVIKAQVIEHMDKLVCL